VNIHPSNPVDSGDDPLAGVGRWRNWLYRTIAGNALSPALFHNLPTNRAVELGTQIAI
jgi:K+ transporter